MTPGCVPAQRTRSVPNGHSRKNSSTLLDVPIVAGEWFLPNSSLASGHDLRAAQDTDGQLLRRWRELDIFDIA